MGTFTVSLKDYPGGSLCTAANCGRPSEAFIHTDGGGTFACLDHIGEVIRVSGEWMKPQKVAQ